MNIGAEERTKLYAVAGLLVVALVVAYFRFWKKADEPAGTASVVLLPGSLDTIPELPTWVTSGTGAPRKRAPHTPASRDIFAAVTDAVANGNQTGGSARRDLPRLSSIVIGGQSRFAVINERMVRVGERVDAYRVTKIEREYIVITDGQTNATIYVGTSVAPRP